MGNKASSPLQDNQLVTVRVDRNPTTVEEALVAAKKNASIPSTMPLLDVGEGRVYKNSNNSEGESKYLFRHKLERDHPLYVTSGAQAAHRGENLRTPKSDVLLLVKSPPKNTDLVNKVLFVRKPQSSVHSPPGGAT